MEAIAFDKMHGLGNDFVILDARESYIPGAEDALIRQELVARLADRHRGIGCDQLLICADPHATPADLALQIFNADGGEVEACGNATRCVAWLEMKRGGHERLTIATPGALIACTHAGSHAIAANMGRPRWLWQEVPMSRPHDTCYIPHGLVGLEPGVAINVGNPHLVIFVEDLEAVPLDEVGPALETHRLFPRHVNVTLAEIESASELRLKTWERGVGPTLACGTAACAVMVAARRRGEVAEAATMHLPGGTLELRWAGTETDSEHDIWMTGAVAHTCSGIINADILAGLE